MKKVLYLSNIEVPYRAKFFNELSKHCDLTVLYERNKSSNRDDSWSGSVPKNYKVMYLNGIKIGMENTFSLRIMKFIIMKYDVVVVGCYNSLVQMLAIVMMRLLKIPYILSTDGELFLNQNTWKGKLKYFFLKGASRYLSAGEKAADRLGELVGRENVDVYYFSSIHRNELDANELRMTGNRRERTVLVIGQYFHYKGLDVAIEAVRMDRSIHYKFVGTGKRSELFKKECGIDKLSNVEIIPFLSKTELEEEYLNCALMVLPSRQECWGLVVNEAASFGTPIVSTWGAGGALEFLSDEYPQYLAKPGDADDLLRAIRQCFESETDEYSQFLLKKAKGYSIEKQVEVHIRAIGEGYPKIL